MHVEGVLWLQVECKLKVVSKLDHRVLIDMRSEQPMMEEVSEYWEGVNGVPGHFNPEDPAIFGWQESVSEAIPFNIGTMDESLWKQVLNLKLLVEMVHACTFWWKSSYQAAGLLQVIIQWLIGCETEALDWFVMESVLIPK